MDNNYQNDQKGTRKISWVVVGLVGIAVIVITGLLVWPQIKSRLLQPDLSAGAVGTVYPITPLPRPKPNGVAAGDPNSKIKIEVYEDFQCPACREYSINIEPQILRNLVATGKAYYVFRSFLIIDRSTWDSPKKESHQAANAAMCAADQERFWDYHDILFNNWTGENVGDFTDPRLFAYANNLKLDMAKFTACFSANDHKAQIDADIAGGLKLGVDGTPSVFVNGQQVTPGYIPSFSAIQELVDQLTPK